MPNAKVLSEKQQIVANLTDKLGKACSGILVDYRGITVEEDTKLRANLRAESVEYSVVKNTLLRFAVEKSGYPELDQFLNGTTALALGYDDPIVPARLIGEFASKTKNKNFQVKAGFIEGKFIDAETIDRLSKLPSKNTLIATVLGTMNAPIAALARALKAIADQQGGGETAEAAPAEA